MFYILYLRIIMYIYICIIFLAFSPLNSVITCYVFVQLIKFIYIFICICFVSNKKMIQYFERKLTETV